MIRRKSFILYDIALNQTNSATRKLNTSSKLYQTPGTTTINTKSAPQHLPPTYPHRKKKGEKTADEQKRKELRENKINKTKQKKIHCIFDVMF